jgi:hypothetical protein
MIDLRDFAKDEIIEINTYVNNNVPFSVLQSIFPLTENPKKKVQVYTIMYRIINGAMNYTEGELKVKLQELLKENEEIYKELYSLTLKSTTVYNWAKHRIDERMLYVLHDFNKSVSINKLIDAFLIFAEKQVLVDTDRVTGLEMDTQEGKELYKKIITGEGDVGLATEAKE